MQGKPKLPRSRSLLRRTNVVDELGVASPIPFREYQELVGGDFASALNKYKIHVAMEYPHHSWMGKVVAQVIFVLTVLYLVVMTLRTIPFFFNANKFWWIIPNAVCTLAFCIELGLRLYSVPVRKLFFKDWLNIIDILSVTPLFLELIITKGNLGLSPIDSGTGSTAYRVLRGLRVLRMFRMFKLGRYNEELHIFNRTFVKSVSALVMIVLLTSLSTIVFGAIVYYTERDAQPHVFTSIPASMWWAVITLVTVGYGDMVPVTTAGKVVGILAMLVGAITVKLPITIMGATCVREYIHYKDRKRVLRLARSASRGSFRRHGNSEIPNVAEAVSHALKELELETPRASAPPTTTDRQLKRSNSEPNLATPALPAFSNTISHTAPASPAHTPRQVENFVKEPKHPRSNPGTPRQVAQMPSFTLRRSDTQTLQDYIQQQWNSNSGTRQATVRSFRLELFQALELPRTSKVGQLYAMFNMLVVSLSIVVLCMQTVEPYATNHHSVLQSLEIGCMSVFSLDIVLRVISTPTMWSYLKDPINIADVIAVVPFYINLIFGANARVLTSMRVLRAMRISRATNFYGLNTNVSFFLNTLAHCWPAVYMLLFATALHLLLGATAVYEFESGAWNSTAKQFMRNGQASQFQSIPAGFWWVMQTITTVGYGDVVPETVAGKVVGSLLAVSGVVALTLPVAIIGANFSALYDIVEVKKPQTDPMEVHMFVLQHRLEDFHKDMKAFQMYLRQKYPNLTMHAEGYDLLVDQDAVRQVARRVQDHYTRVEAVAHKLSNKSKTPKRSKRSARPGHAISRNFELSVFKRDKSRSNSTPPKITSAATSRSASVASIDNTHHFRL